MGRERVIGGEMGYNAGGIKGNPKKRRYNAHLGTQKLRKRRV